MDQSIFFLAALRIFRRWGRAVTALIALVLASHIAPVCGAEDREKSALEKIQQRGVLTVSRYRDFAHFSDIGIDVDPYSVNGKGIDVDLAKAMAATLGAKMSPMWFDASEGTENDFRKMVWYGTGLGDDSRFAIDSPLHPVLKAQQWMLGLAVKTESDDLATALESAMSELTAHGAVTQIMQHYGVTDRQS